MKGTCPCEKEALGQVRPHGTQSQVLQGAKGAADFDVSQKKKANADRSAPADFTHRRRRTVSALH